jgi:regulator of sirC expression with transglutaminase-like and TPR domain
LAGPAKLSPDIRASLHRVQTHLIGHQGRLAEALAANDRFLALVPAQVDGLLDRARIFEAMARPAEARDTLTTLLAAHPGHQAAQQLLRSLTAMVGRDPPGARA